MKLKVCGMTEVDQILQLDQLGIDYAGFIFYEKSPRYALQKLKCEDIKNLQVNLKKVGVFVNAEPDEIIKAVENCGLDMVQLHGDETPVFCATISNHVSVIKAIRVSEEENIEYKIQPYIDACDMFLFDTASTVYGGSGQKFNWQTIAYLSVNKPFLLSGGLHPGDEKAIEEFIQFPIAKDLLALDINSGFEVEPGIKNLEEVKAFLQVVRNINVDKVSNEINNDNII